MFFCAFFLFLCRILAPRFNLLLRPFILLFHAHFFSPSRHPTFLSKPPFSPNSNSPVTPKTYQKAPLFSLFPKIRPNFIQRIHGWGISPFRIYSTRTWVGYPKKYAYSTRIWVGCSPKIPFHATTRPFSINAPYIPAAGWNFFSFSPKIPP